MKHGSGSEGEHLHGTSSISPCSPALPQLWEVSMANKGAPVHPSSYMNTFGHWYPNHHPHHQDAMHRPQMMWVDSFWTLESIGLHWTCWCLQRSPLRTESLGDLVYIHCILCVFWILKFSLQELFRHQRKKKGGGGVISLQALVAGSDISETWVCVCSLKDILDKITFFKYTVSVRLLY